MNLVISVWFDVPKLPASLIKKNDEIQAVILIDGYGNTEKCSPLAPKHQRDSKKSCIFPGRDQGLFCIWYILRCFILGVILVEEINLYSNSSQWEQMGTGGYD